MKAYHQGQLDFFCALYAFINSLKLICGLSLADARLIFAESLQEISARPLLWQALLENDSDYYWLLRYLFGHFSRKPAYAFKIGQLPVSPLNNLDRKKIRAERQLKQPSGQGQIRLYGISEAEIRAWIGLKPPEPLNLDEVRYENLYARPVSGKERTDREKNWSIGELWPLLQSWMPVKHLFSSFSNAEEQKTCIILRFHRYLYPGHPPVVSHWTTGFEFKSDTLQLFDCTADKMAVHSLPIKECTLSENGLCSDSLIRLEPESIYFMERVKA